MQQSMYDQSKSKRERKEKEKEITMAIVKKMNGFSCVLFRTNFRARRYPIVTICLLCLFFRLIYTCGDFSGQNKQR
jgi:hypothetical protein